MKKYFDSGPRFYMCIRCKFARHSYAVLLWCQLIFFNCCTEEDHEVAKAHWTLQKIRTNCTRRGLFGYLFLLFEYLIIWCASYCDRLLEKVGRSCVVVGRKLHVEWTTTKLRQLGGSNGQFARFVQHYFHTNSKEFDLFLQLNHTVLCEDFQLFGLVFLSLTPRRPRRKQIHKTNHTVLSFVELFFRNSVT